jgi:predicted enzyme related to lactoylglutathione lyase
MSNHSKSLLAVGLAAALLAGPVLAQSPEPAAPAPRIDLPPVSARPTGKRLPGKVVWFDLLTLDPAAVKPFYSGVLGWTFEDRDGYAIARDGATPVAGILQMPAPKPGAATPQARWMPLISVPDVAQAAAAAQKAGGRVMEGPGSLGARGRYAAVADPRGAQFVLITAAGGDPADLDAPPPGWIWAELWTDDLKGSAAFYKAVVGYETWQVGSGKAATWIYASGGRPRARAARMPFQKVPAQWLPYVVVKDLPVALARVTELGGHVLRKPGAKGPQFAVVSDPGGATFILEQRPDQPADEVVQTPVPAPAVAGAAATGAAPPPPPPPPPSEPDPFGIGAAEQKSADEAAAQAAAQDRQPGAIPFPGGSFGADVNVVVAPAPFVNVWIAPPAWGPFWGPGWGAAPGWGGAAWWGAPPMWGPGFPPPYYPGRQPYYPGYRPPPPPRPGPGPGPRPPGPSPRYSAPGARPSGAPMRAAPAAPAPSRPAPPAPHR